MRIAIVTSCIKPIPGPKDSIYAPGQIISQLADGLVELGHDVTLYASSESKTKAKLVSFDLESTYSAYRDKENSDPSLFYEMKSTRDLYVAARVLEDHKAKPYDIIHAHDYRRLMFLSKCFDRPLLYTHHGIANNDASEDIFQRSFEYFYNNNYFVGISKNQIEKGRKWFNYIGMVHNAIDIKMFPFRSNPENKLLFAGRLIENKNPHLALEAAKLSGEQIMVAGSGGGKYWEDKIAPYQNESFAEFLGHVGYETMPQIYGSAKALIMPITWDEPFGMVMIEAMACGTPVIAFNHGSVSELVKDGLNGFIVRDDTVEAIVEAIREIHTIDRKVCHDYAVNNFAKERMVKNYEQIYESYLSNVRRTK